MKYLFNISVLLFLLSCYSCNEDETILIDSTEETPDHIITVFSQFDGYIINSNEEPVSNAIVLLAGEQVTTDEEGYFKISGDANQDGAYIKVIADGYFESYANVTPAFNQTKHIRFTLLERNESGTINSSSGGIISGENYIVEFQQNSIKDAAGQVYNGLVTVFATYLDPTLEGPSATMPGDLLAINNEEQSRILSSYGMVHVELEGEDGQQLNLLKPATLSIKVPESKLTTAPSMIPLWYFDTELGIWKEEGTANYIDGMFTGEVSHFSLWNCDLDFDFINVTGTVSFNGVGVTNVWVEAKWVAENDIVRPTLDSTGTFNGKAPQNSELEIVVMDYCGNVLATELIVTGTSDSHYDIDVLEPCVSGIAYEIYYGFNGNLLHLIPGVTVKETDPNLGYLYEFEFTDHSQSPAMVYRYFVIENAGEYEFIINAGPLNPGTFIYSIEGKFNTKEETSDYVYFEGTDLHIQMTDAQDPDSFTWYIGEFHIRGKKI